jgi:predicted Holliday junction resolvase-like endonuclease
MNKIELIRHLQSSNLYAECSECGREFKLSDAILFDGCGPFPKIAQVKRQELLKELKERIKELEKRKIRADIGAEKKAIEVGFGKIIEKIIPAHKGFKPTLSDCRPLFEPIDMIVFNGATNLNISSVTFLEIKTGDAKINPHERMIQEAIKNKRITYRVI